MSNIKCDKKTCIGCLACVYACKDAHKNDSHDDSYEHAVSRRSYEKVTAKDTGVISYKTKSCMHCKKAKCMEACPAEVIYRDEYDFVQIRYYDCLGCHACEEACPFGAITFAEGKDMPIVHDGYPFKCDGCADRLREGLEPACVSVCPVHALSLASTVK